MELDITGKVGIENALELLEENLAEHRFQFSEECEDKWEQGFNEGIEAALMDAIEIVKLNLPVKTK